MVNVPQRWPLAFKDLDQFRREFDDLFERMLGRCGIKPAQIATPAIESYVENDILVIRADVPGIDPKDIDISVSGNNLVIRARRESKSKRKARDYRHREISYGSLERSIPLPDGVKADQINASYKDGVLEVTMPLPKEAAGRKISVRS